MLNYGEDWILLGAFSGGFYGACLMGGRGNTGKNIYRRRDGCSQGTPLDGPYRTWSLSEGTGYLRWK